MDAEQGQVVADQPHHLFDGEFADGHQPFGLRPAEPFASVALGKRAAGFREVFAGIQALGNGSDRFAQSFAVAQMGRPREHIDLGAGVVDVVLALHAEPGLGQQPGQRVPDHRAAAVPDMHRARRVGGHELDIDPLAAPDRRIAKRRAGTQDGAQLRVPDLGSQPDVDKTRPRWGGREPAAAIVPGHELASGKGGGDPLGENHRVFFDRPGEHHCRVGRQIAMRGIARQLDRDTAQIEPVRQYALRRELIERRQLRGGESRRRCWSC